jgi:radical SAM-linked protein
LLDDMRRVRTGGLTFAPEAGTQRMRDVINKNVTEAQLMETAERVFSKGFDNMKLYFIIGLPTEEDDDVRGIVHVAQNALAVAKRLGRARAKITVSVSTHVPKPHTPFQWAAMDSLDEIRRKQALLRAELGTNRRIQLRFHDSSTSHLEGIFARGDRRLADAMEHAFEHGARFDSWEDQLDPALWKRAFEACNIDTRPYLATLPVGARLPWSHFDVGLEAGFLEREYRKALRSRLSPPCGKVAGTFIHHTNVEEASADDRRLVCYDCGIACDMTRMREQRVEFLQQMGAQSPTARRLPLAEPAVASSPAGTVRAPHPELGRPRQPGDREQRWRLTYEKLGPSALLGHLDFMRELGRVIRRAGLRPVYSKGFRPKPRLTFGPALALGVAGLGEKIEVDLIDPPQGAEILKGLNGASGAGLHFTTAEPMASGDPTLGAVVWAARYLFAFADSAGVAPEAMEAKIAAFLGREKVVVKRMTKGIGRLVDVRSRVLSLTMGDSTTQERVRRAGIVGRVTTLEAEVLLGPDGSVKPTEIVEALLGDAQYPHHAIRDALLIAAPPSGQPMPIAPDNSGAIESAAQ